MSSVTEVVISDEDGEKKVTTEESTPTTTLSDKKITALEKARQTRIENRKLNDKNKRSAEIEHQLYMNSLLQENIDLKRQIVEMVVPIKTKPTKVVQESTIQEPNEEPVTSIEREKPLKRYVSTKKLMQAFGM